MSTNNTFRKEERNEVFDQFFSPNTPNNKVYLIGTMKFKFVHYYTSAVTGEKFYKTTIVIQRKSGLSDNVIIVSPEKLICGNLECFKIGSQIKIYGALKSIYIYVSEAKKKKTKVYVLIQHIELYQHSEITESNNFVYLEGKVCSFPFSIKTVDRSEILPNTQKRISTRTVTNILVSLRGEDDRIIRIPCIAWGKYSELAKTLVPEDKIIIKGKIQSRVYHEPNVRNPNELVNREVYEVSIFEIVEVIKKTF